MREISILKQRILQYLDYKGFSKYKFYQDTGLSNGILSQSNGMSEENTLRLLNYYTDLNPTWLLTGKGEMITNNEPPVTKPKDSFMPSVITVDQIGRDNVLMVPTKARAGYLAGYGDPKFLAELPSYHMPGLGPGMWRDFEVSGLSMYPTINDKDHVIGKYVESIEEIKDNRVYVIVSEEGVIVKRILNRVEADGVLICKSDNKMHHPNIVLPAEEVKEVWDAKVLITRHLEDPNALYQQVGDLEARMTLLEEALKNKLH